ncbi:alpha-L-arabinofuranosidase [Sphingobacterium shayense]|uniref:alpha-L-arabinofuranosidase C-terminal domain-containing protein n=1 Tax=Sphingobacterium shayense TaxID=626343 RepID=UPI0015549111|nr:alpha-L-arabinofuranosidase C-terminal domain-containing protein [Sphingobacterium shayense]NQD69739.1 alpha-L-arabinofuranosidase [Sphingobacterium shayense]
MRSIILLLLFVNLFPQAKASEPDSAYIFAYSTSANNHHNGLHFAWSIDKKHWQAMGPERSYLSSDYGRWGSQKMMFNPYLFRSPDGTWHCVWGLNEHDGAFAYTSSKDLIYWKSQSYPLVYSEGNVKTPVLSFDSHSSEYTVRWQSDSTDSYGVYTKDFKTFSTPRKVRYLSQETKINLAGETLTGTMHKVEWAQIEKLLRANKLGQLKQTLYSERAIDDSVRFPTLKPVEGKLSLLDYTPRKISDLFMGIFFEDINYAADGGLYAELVQNRGFEYSSTDKEGWNNLTSWKGSRDDVRLLIDSMSPVHENNKHFLNLKAPKGQGVINEGFDGYALLSGQPYDFTVYARSKDKNVDRLVVRILDSLGQVVAEGKTKRVSEKWAKYDVTIQVKSTVPNARLLLMTEEGTVVDLDMVSLFPRNTFRNRKNGMRADIANAIAEMKPRFVRFPGGCVAHGDGLENIYHWKNTIGPLEARLGQRNLWGYHQSYGLGYYEYFQFCEDLGAEPIPVVAAGVPCQNSGHHGHPIGGQQCGIAMENMGAYIQDVLDLIEYANGDNNSTWGRKRVEAGHPEPFGLKYIGIGNEDMITDIFVERFTMIYQAVKQKYPEIQVIGTSGPFYEGTDYVEGWNLADKLKIPLVDEHYYTSPGWFLHNQDFYDKYDRTKSKVYLGEYAAHISGRASTIETALAEALHLCNLERNGDIVAMTSYAPLLAKTGNTQWNPDLIYFDNQTVRPTVGYFVQQLFGSNSGDEYFFSSLKLANKDERVTKRVAKSVVRDSKTGDLIVKLVNMLPVVVSLETDFSSLGVKATTAEATVLTGALEDKHARPKQFQLDLENLVLEPYSFSVLRLKTEQ